MGDSDNIPQTLYVFWEHNSQIGILGAEVKRFRPNGTVEPKGFEDLAVIPISILPGQAGVDAVRGLSILKSTLAEGLTEVRRSHRIKAEVLIHRFKEGIG